MSDQQPAPRVYVPEDHDPLRDGLYAGFWAHRKPQPKQGEVAPDIHSNVDEIDVSRTSKIRA